MVLLVLVAAVADHFGLSHFNETIYSNSEKKTNRLVLDISTGWPTETSDIEELIAQKRPGKIYLSGENEVGVQSLEIPTENSEILIGATVVVGDGLKKVLADCYTEKEVDSSDFPQKGLLYISKE